ncbi:MAG TPA: 2-C-methyl-D-erythritol 4-phosphate cytidylyltransferase [Acidobacteriota bacterium]|nr:2-C-methyl-D-erythritol 4-phosphate cytidylyltransferase [Acidobacteriota bacterium]
MKVAAVIAAGGTGTRMNTPVPKQFLEISGKPIFIHTIERISSLEDVVQIILALPEEHIPAAAAILNGMQMRVAVQCVAGGRNRQESVHRGVRHVRPDADVIMVHDAVRPVCDADTMRRVLDAAREKGAAVPGLPATETIQRVSRKGRVLATPPREELFAIQTPQAFHAEILRSALDRAADAGFVGTDESSVVRYAGHPVTVVPGSPDNIKITRPMDLEIAERLISGNLTKEDGTDMSESRFRIGQGIDFHRLVEGRKLILGGVDIPFERGLEGHSDADVLAHAICDALLGAAAMGDIGQQFPDTDPAHRNRSSMEFLVEVRTKIEAAGWRIQNVDATMLAQRPKLMPYAAAMKTNIAASLGIGIDAVSIKATTTEGMNAEGRGEGISAQAIALLQKK